MIGMRWNQSKRNWSFNDSIINRNMFNQEFKAGLETPTLSPNPFFEPHHLAMEHQKEAAFFANDTPRHLFAHDTGVGKTFLGIDLVKQKKCKTLVVCPLSIIETAWIDDLKQFGNELSYVNLWKAKRIQRKKYLDLLSDSQICLINFESFRKQRSDLEQAGFGMVHIDESSKVKNHKSKITKALTEFCDDVYYTYLFSATPAPNNELEYFSQARIVDPTIFGTSFYRFRNKYFYPTGYEGHLWLLQKEKKVEFYDKIAQFTSVVKKEDVLDLPERTFNTIDINLSPAETRAYKEMEKHLILEIENEEITAHNAAVKLMKLRQVTSGFIFNEDGTIIDIGKSKRNELLSLLEIIGDKQVLIWTQFQHEANVIKQALLKEHLIVKDRLLGKQTHRTRIINGTIPHADREQAFKDFKSGKVQYLIAHPRSLGHGVTMTNCSYAIYYSISYSHEEHKQSQDRIYRKGQTNACTYYYLLAPGTVDKAIYNALNSKANVEGTILKYVKSKHGFH
jgi:SNF2 family DNA or RNA helicase